MNLSEAFDAALPEIPQARLTRGRPPRLDPDLIVRDDTLDGEPIVGVFQSEGSNYYRFPPAQWQMLQLFNGERTFEEIAEETAALAGQQISAEELRLFADNLEEANFWYKSPQEKNIALSQKIAAQRNRRAERKSKFNVAHISFSAWDPDTYLTRLDAAIGRYLYSPWCVLATFILFMFEFSVFVSKWSFIEPDIALYYNFLNKGFGDMVQFWLLILILGFVHESAHGLTCKHFGGEVHRMGLMFLFLTPCFFVDMTAIWINSSKIERIYTIIAGMWSEMVICGLAMIVWVNTQSGQWIHDLAYQVILLSGLAVVVINVNPLIKLDGYYCMTELMGLPDLKERSTAFMTGWFQSQILRLPVETLAVPRRRVPLFIVYALLSGAYSYFLLFFVIRLSYNIFSHWLAEFALIPSGYLAFVMFRPRLRSLRKVAANYWELKIRSGRFLRPLPLFAVVLVAVLLLAPIWRDREDAWFVIEPAHTETLHAAVPGRLEQVLVKEGETVFTGQPLLRMSSLMAASMHSSASAQAGSAQYQAVSAELKGQSIGPAAAQQNASRHSTSLAGEAVSSLEITAPSAGIVLTQDPGSLLYRNVAAGQSLLDLASAAPPVVRVYIPVSALDRITPDSEVALALPDRFSILRIPMAPFGSDAEALPAGLIPKQKYQGIKLPVFYCSRMALPASARNALFGVSGPAKIFGERRSLAARGYTILANLAKAHVW
jgi:putative peptide zinc metalloprotease protein